MCVFNKNMFFERNNGVKQPGGWGGCQNSPEASEELLLLEGFRCLCLGEW